MPRNPYRQKDFGSFPPFIRVKVTGYLTKRKFRRVKDVFKTEPHRKAVLQDIKSRLANQNKYSWRKKAILRYRFKTSDDGKYYHLYSWSNAYNFARSDTWWSKYIMSKGEWDIL